MAVGDTGLQCKHNHKSEFFSPTNAPFIKHIQMLKYLYACSYMFRSTWTILRELVLSLAKATNFFLLISKNTSLYDLQCCGNEYFRLWCVYRMPCSHTLHDTQYTQHSLKYLLPQRRISYNDVFPLISSTIL
jgi:hypothetical protein